MSWTKVKLGDVAETNLGKMLDQHKNRGDFHPYLANVNVRWGSFDLENLPLMKFESDELDRFGLRYGDLIVCEGGEPGRCAIWKENLPGIKFQKALHRVRVKDCMDYRYVFYWFLYAGKRHALDQYFTGSTIKHMPADKLRQVVIDYPPLKIQKKIGEVLSAYDNLIENNQKQIKLLEEAAQRLYKEWFIDLRFPGHETTKIQNDLPEGWQEKSVSTLGEFLNGFAFKPSDWFDKGLPIIKIKEMGGGVSKDTPRNKGERVPQKYLVKAGDILFSWSATLMAMVWNDENGWLNQHIFKVVPEKGICREFLLQSLKNTIDEFSNLTTGSTMKHIQRGKLDQVFVKVPNEGLMKKYELLANSIREQILTLSKKINLLQESRDRLLPKLMSGEIEV